MAVRTVSGVDVKDGSALAALVAVVNDLAVGFNTLTAKLDAENVTNLDTDYAATCGTIDTLATRDVATPT